MTTTTPPQISAAASAAIPPVQHVPLCRRRLAHWSRWLHTYLSMVSFTILLFFAVTGLTLNHQAALTGEVKPHRYTGTFEISWMKAPDAKKDDIVAAFRSRHRIKADLSDFRVDDDQVQVSFKGPGYAADAFIDRATGKYELMESRLGFVAVINDLHKGRDTGKAWAGVIDVSAVLMTLVSLSGLTLIFFLHKKLRTGLIALAIGTALCYVVYLIWVP
ncbi:MAG TPA: PepSY-associated TM helix domain-containing protein [Bryobacteraceae bacterium]|nr:PepSY-associated TM helix domain-containing protein [Bryobacteraceae bacterium]